MLEAVSEKDLKVITTSRPENDIIRTLRRANGYLSIRIDSATISEDLSHYIDVKVRELVLDKEWNVKWVDKLKNALMKGLGGTFLWAALVLKDLDTIIITRHIETKLSNLPSDLPSVYARILQNIQEQSREVAKFILQWVVASTRPITLDQIAMAQAMEVTEKTWVPTKDIAEDFEDGYKCCIPLLYLDPNNKTLNLVHQTAKDYLLSDELARDPDLSDYYVDTDKANFLLFKNFCRFLSCKDWDSEACNIHAQSETTGFFNAKHWEELDPEQFFHYALFNWDTYGIKIPSKLLRESSYHQQLLNDRPQLYHSLVRQAANHGCIDLLELLIEHCPRTIKETGPARRTVFHLAVLNRNFPVAKFLIEKGANVQEIEGVTHHTPLQLASKEGHEEIVRLLLKHEAITELKVWGWPDGPNMFMTPLHLASMYGHLSVVRLLLDHGADINATASQSLTVMVDLDLYKEAFKTLLLEQSQSRSSGFESLVLPFPFNDIHVNPFLVDGYAAATGAEYQEKFSSIISQIFQFIDDIQSAAPRLFEIIEDIENSRLHASTALDIAIKEGNGDLERLLRAKGALLGAELKRTAPNRKSRLTNGEMHSILLLKIAEIASKAIYDNDMKTEPAAELGLGFMQRFDEQNAQSNRETYDDDLLKKFDPPLYEALRKSGEMRQPTSNRTSKNRGSGSGLNKDAVRRWLAD